MNTFGCSDDCLFLLRDYRRPKTSGLRSPTQYYKILPDKEYINFFQQDIFCENLIAALVERCSIQAEIINTRNNSPEAKGAYTIALSGTHVQQVSAAYDALEMLFGMCLQKIIIDKNIGKI